MGESIRVLIADDHPLFRDGVAHSLASEPDITVMGEAADGEEALRLARDLLPDVLLLDITMPGKGGLAAAAEIAAACPATKIPFVEGFSEALQNRKGILKVPWPAHFKLLKNKVLRGDKPIVAPLKTFLLPAPEYMLVMDIARPQKINRNLPKLKTQLQTPEQRVVFQPSFIQLHTALAQR